jgi:hypothetical protein
MIPKRKKDGGKINTEGWMMSYADMATILLAMFIVLSTFGKDQTGATLQKGLESWKESRQFFGLPGFFTNSSQQHQHNFKGPTYQASEDATDESGDEQAVTLDAEIEKLRRFLKDPGGDGDLARQPSIKGQATLDFFEPLNRQPPYLTAKHRERLSQMLPLLNRKDYTITLVVWATMPVDSALTRAAEQATEIADELRPGGMRTNNFTAIGQPWRYANFQRPIFSLTLRRLEKG